MGIVFSKLAELSIAAIMSQHTGYALSVDIRAIGVTLAVYFAVYVVIFFVAAVQVWRSNPADLFQSETAGEREPSARILSALLGAALVAGGYILSITTLAYIRKHMGTGLTSGVGEQTDQTLNHILMFIIGRVSIFSVLVGAGTLFLFVSGSVFLCKFLKKRKAYYYQTAHFVSVSQMLYRMKRNGVSLAVICVLSTLILIALTGAVGFFSGIRRVVDSHYPHDLTIYAEAPEGAAIGTNEFGETLRLETDGELADAGVDTWTGNAFYYVGLFASYTDGVLDLAADMESGRDKERGENRILDESDGVVCVRVISIDDYDRLLGCSETLSEGEVLIASPKGVDILTGVTDLSGGVHTVKTVLHTLPSLTPFKLYDNITDTGGFETILLAVPDLADFFKDFDRAAWSVNDIRYLWEYDIDLDAATDVQTSVYDVLMDKVDGIAKTEKSPDAGCYLRLERLGEAVGLAGGLFFLAIIVAALLIFVTVLIMYYKQISEGYEDRKRFVIMRKVGMTDSEVRSSISSQMRTVFFFPLIIAGLHLVFSVPLVRLMLKFTVQPSDSVIALTACLSFLAFAVAYMFVYTLTTKTYYRIVDRG